MRIIHILGGLNVGGAETWLMHVLRNLDRDEFQFDFLVHTEGACAYDREAERLGSRIIRLPNPRSPLTYAAGFRRALQRYGPYDVVHSHVSDPSISRHGDRLADRPDSVRNTDARFTSSIRPRTGCGRTVVADLDGTRDALRRQPPVLGLGHVCRAGRGV